MFEDCSGRRAQCVADAERYIWKFIAENLTATDRHVREHSHDFDLYLPWLLEILEYQRGGRDTLELPIIEVQGLYMEAAWMLVMEGFLRPGPRSIMGDPLKDGYGKGYSLTTKGRERIREEMAAFSASENSLTRNR
jgi:hypothetical protein